MAVFYYYYRRYILLNISPNLSVAEDALKSKSSFIELPPEKLDKIFDVAKHISSEYSCVKMNIQCSDCYVFEKEEGIEIHCTIQPDCSNCTDLKSKHPFSYSNDVCTKSYACTEFNYLEIGNYNYSVSIDPLWRSMFYSSTISSYQDNPIKETTETCYLDSEKKWNNNKACLQRLEK